MLRDEIAEALKAAQKKQDKRRTTTLRLIHAAIVDRDIALRGKGDDAANDEEVLELLTKMVKQREESSKLYQQGGRQDLVDQELTEIEIIREFLPEQMEDGQLETVLNDLIEETGAQSLRDMGKVMGLLKNRYPGQIDMGKAGGRIKDVLSNK